MTNIKIVEYNDLVTKPKEVLNSINKFYGLPTFEYELNDLSQFEVNDVAYNDDYLAAPLHIISTDGIKDVKSNTILPDSVIRKYSGLEFWRNK